MPFLLHSVQFVSSEMHTCVSSRWPTTASKLAELYVLNNASWVQHSAAIGHGNRNCCKKKATELYAAYRVHASVNDTDYGNDLRVCHMASMPISVSTAAVALVS